MLLLVKVPRKQECHLSLRFVTSAFRCAYIELRLPLQRLRQYKVSVLLLATLDSIFKHMLIKEFDVPKPFRADTTLVKKHNASFEPPF